MCSTSKFKRNRPILVASFFGAQHGPRPLRSREEPRGERSCHNFFVAAPLHFQGCQGCQGKEGRFPRPHLSEFPMRKAGKFSRKASAAFSQTSDVALLQPIAQQLRRLKLWQCVLGSISQLQTGLHVAPSLLK